MNLAIIPARGGSRRIHRKNIRAFHGKAIIGYSIETARACGLFDKVIVSTEDALIAEVAKRYGARIHHRARRLADDITGTQAVVRNALEWWAKNVGERPSYVCCIYPTAPLMEAGDLLHGYNVMLEQDRDFVYTEGWFYWGAAQAFLDERLLDGPRVLRVEIPERWVDINTEDDWRLAEQLYAKQQKVAA